MKVHILSDLHTEFSPFKDPKPERDLVVLAGDIGVGYDVIPFVRSFEQSCKTVFVAGNHEYYGGNLEQQDNEYQGQLPDSFLQMDVVECRGYKIAGTTLWTNFCAASPSEKGIIKARMNDYRRICKDSRGGCISIENTKFLHETMAAFLRDWAANAGPLDIIVTHHGPSYKSISPKYQGDIMNAAFCSNLDWLVEELKPKLWVHGHVHNSADYMIGDTRVVANPRGYPVKMGYENKQFNPSLVVEV